MNPAFLGSRLFTSEMPRFLHKIGHMYRGNWLVLSFWCISRYLGHFIVAHIVMNPAFLDSRLFLAEMPHFLYKIGHKYRGNW